MKVFGLIAKLKGENRQLSIVALVLAFVVAGEGMAMYKMYQHKTTIFLPPKVDKEFWVAGDNVSSSYLEQIAYYIADRILTVSPENVDSSLSAVYPFLSSEPEDIQKVKAMLASFSNAIKRENYYQTFYPMKFYQSQRKLIVEGMMRKSSGQIYIGEEKQQITFLYDVRNGRFTIKEVVLK